jgi:hypothetical protein
VGYKRSPTLQVEDTRFILPSSRELVKYSAHPIVILVLLQYDLDGCRAITSKEGPEPG